MTFNLQHVQIITDNFFVDRYDEHRPGLELHGVLVKEAVLMKNKQQKSTSSTINRY